MPLNTAVIDRTYGPETFVVSGEQVSRYKAATQDPATGSSMSAEPVPAAFAFLPCWPIIQNALADPDLGNAPGQIIHGEQTMHFERPLRIGDVLATTGKVTRIEPKGRNELYVLTLESRDPETGELVVTQDNICISLGSGPGDSSERPKRSGGSRSEQPEPMRTRTVRLPSNITRLYADASGDHSAVHLDDDAAVALGFPGVIVHGMCLLAITLVGAVQPQNESKRPSVKGLRVRFSSPIQPGEELTSRYWDGDAVCEFDAVGLDGRRVLSGGQVVFAGSGGGDNGS